MPKKIAFLPLILILFTFCNSDPALETFPELNGPYLGQSLPDSLPVLFAPSVMGTGMFTRDIAISPDGDELYYCISVGNYTYSTILFSKKEQGSWSKPAVAPFSADARILDLEPAFSPDGNRLYFLSTRSDGTEEAGDQDIWYVERNDEGWSEAINPGEPLNSDGGEFFPSLTKDGYLYFTRVSQGSSVNEIYRSKQSGESFSEPELLPGEVNCGTNRFNAFVSPDHRYIILAALGMKDAYDGSDYYIIFRNESDQWSEAINMGEAVNKGNTRGWSPYVSADGEYFFFMANFSKEISSAELSYELLQKLHTSPGNGNPSIYWMKADFIDDLRKQAVFQN